MPWRTLDIQVRDVALLQGLFESRVMTLSHVATLYFDGRKEAAKKRVQRLKAAGFISERRRRPYEPAVLSFTRSTLGLLSEHGLLAEYISLAPGRLERRSNVSELTISHELAVMDCKAALHAAVSSLPALEIGEFSTWPAQHQFHAAPVAGLRDAVVKPDGFFRLLETAPPGQVFEHAFFLELDRSTETQEKIGVKAACYVDYYRRGGFAEKNGHSADEYKDFPFRVLMVFRTAERRNNAAERLLTESPSIRTQVWLTVFDELKRDPLGPIWVQPLDYLRLTTGTAFEPSIRARYGVYRRQIDRDAFVEQSIVKRCLLHDS